MHQWQTPAFAKTLKADIAKCEPGVLPLQQASTQGGYINDSNISSIILNQRETSSTIMITVGLFFNEVVPSCSCGDEPLEITAHCELIISINKSTAETLFELIEESNFPEL